MAEVDRCIGPSSKQLVQLLKNGLLASFPGKRTKAVWIGKIDSAAEFATTR